MKPSAPTLPCSNWLVATVVPCRIAEISVGEASEQARILSIPARKPSAGSSGVDGVLVVTTVPVRPSTATTSVNVPPVSMPIRMYPTRSR